MAQISPEALAVVDAYGALDWPYFWTLGGDHDASDEYFGLDGEYTREQQRRYRDNQRFWAVPTDDVLLQGMHGEVIADDSKMVQLVEFVGGVDTVTAQWIVDRVQAAIESDPALGYDHPLFTFNAYAWSGEIPGLGPIPDKIILGDGLLQAMEEIGLGDVAPDMVLAHEFAHHVQVELGIQDLPDWSPEQNRRVEMMADAFGAYHLAHARGATFRADRLLETMASVANAGDCAVDSLLHHGTPEQRAAAASRGIALATERLPGSEIVEPADLVTAFDEALPGLLDRSS